MNYSPLFAILLLAFASAQVFHDTAPVAIAPAGMSSAVKVSGPNAALTCRMATFAITSFPYSASNAYTIDVKRVSDGQMSSFSSVPSVFNFYWASGDEGAYTITAYKTGGGTSLPFAVAVAKDPYASSGMKPCPYYPPMFRASATTLSSSKGVTATTSSTPFRAGFKPDATSAYFSALGIIIGLGLLMVAFYRYTEGE